MSLWPIPDQNLKIHYTKTHYEKLNQLTRAPMGYSLTLPADSGGGASPLLSTKLLGRLSIRKRYLISPGLKFLNMLQHFICDDNDDVTGRVKCKVRDLLASPGKAAVPN